VSEGRSSASGSQDEVRVAPAQEVLKKGDLAVAAVLTGGQPANSSRKLKTCLPKPSMSVAICF